MIDYRAAWFKGHADCTTGKPIEACPFDNPGEAKMWRAGWWYKRVNPDKVPQ